jgi:hypothetical protein
LVFQNSSSLLSEPFLYLSLPCFLALIYLACWCWLETSFFTHTSPYHDCGLLVLPIVFLHRFDDVVVFDVGATNDRDFEATKQLNAAMQAVEEEDRFWESLKNTNRSDHSAAAAAAASAASAQASNKGKGKHKGSKDASSTSSSGGGGGGGLASNHTSQGGAAADNSGGNEDTGGSSSEDADDDDDTGAGARNGKGGKNASGKGGGNSGKEGGGGEKGGSGKGNGGKGSNGKGKGDHELTDIQKRRKNQNKNKGHRMGADRKQAKGFAP